MTEEFLPDSQGHNLALTVLHVPCSLDRGGLSEAGSYLRLIDSCITQLRLKDLLRPVTRVKKKKKKRRRLRVLVFEKGLL